MKMSTVLSIIPTALIVGIMSLQESYGADLSGTWSGDLVCNCYNGKSDLKIRTEIPELLISQDDDVTGPGSAQVKSLVYMSVPGGNPQKAYVGEINPNLMHPESGEVVFVECGPSVTLEGPARWSEMGRAGFRIASAKQTFDATSILAAVFAEDPGYAVNACTCSWRFDRVSDIDPLVPSCALN